MAENESKDAGSLGKNRSQTASSVATGNPASTVAESNRGNTPGGSRNGPTELPAQFGRYRVIKKLGGGGMGTVYLVENTELERLEALKVPHFSDGDDPQVRERFLREAKSAAKLDHPNLCEVYSASVQDGVYYMTMRFLNGKLLSDNAGKSRPARKAVEIVTKLAQALESAHGTGVIHRDLKPSNVMMVAGVGPVVMDFGLAKQVRKADQTLTQAGATLGTPAYMPPEQVNGDLDRMGPATDVYSLGVVLYELLTERLPFEGTMASIFGQILYVEPPMPSALVPGLSPALDGICRKAMAKEPTERFPSMKAFAAALQDYLRSSPTAEGAGKLVPTAGDKAAVFQADTVAPGRRPAGSGDIYQMATVPPQARRSTPPTPRGALPPTEYRPTDGARKTNKKAGATTGDEGTSQSSIVVVLAVSLIFALTTIAIGGVLWAAGVFRVRTADGTLVVEVNEPNPDVYVDGAKVTVAWQNGGVKAEVAVKPGTRKVELKKDGFGAFGEEVTLEEHGRTLLHARLDPIKSTTEAPVAPKPPDDASPPEISTTHAEEVGLKRDDSKVAEPQPTAGAEIEPVTRTVYLSDLDETDWSGHADFGKNGTSKTADVAVNGVKFHKGLSTHPKDRGSASVKYRLAGLDATAFVTKVAINDSTLPTIPTSLTFQVLGDGEILWTSAPTRQKGQMQECQISVKDVRVLELRVNCPGWYHGAHAVWLDPYLLLSGPRKAAQGAEKPQPQAASNGLPALDAAARAPTNAPSRGRPKRPPGNPPQLSKSAPEKRDQPVAAVDLLPAGSVWKGTRSYRKGGYAGNTVSYELYVQERSGTTFKGYKIDNGKNRLEIEGEIDGGTISWSERLGTTSEVHFRAQGRLTADEITFNFQGVPFFIEGDGRVKRE